MNQTDDLSRIMALPYCKPAIERAGNYTAALTRYFPNPYQLNPVQNAALSELQGVGGLIADAGVGDGKTLLALLLGSVIEVDKVFVFLPPKRVLGFEEEFAKFRPYFRIHPRLEVMTYSKISVRTDAITSMGVPRKSLWICDEAHCLAAPRTARTLRFMRGVEYWRSKGHTVYLAFMTGTLIKRSIKDYAHLAALALGLHSPLPLNSGLLEHWANVLDDNNLSFLGAKDYDALRPLLRGKEAHSLKDWREAYRQRIEGARGFVLSPNLSTDAPLYIRKLRRVIIPPDLLTQAKYIERTRQSPDGEIFPSDDAQTLSIRQLLCGYYYRAKWPKGAKDHDWLDARNRWNAQVRRVLARSLPGLETPGNVYNKYAANLVNEPGLVKKDLLYQDLAEWQKQKIKKPPDIEHVVLSTWLVEWVMNWLKTQPPTIVWYLDLAMGDMLRKHLPVYDRNNPLVKARAHHCGAAIGVFGEGENLQLWKNGLLVHPPASAKGWEQLLGRFHRQGQTEAVNFWVLAHHPIFDDLIESARRNAAFGRDMHSRERRLLIAEWSEQ